MARRFSESDFADSGPRRFSEADFSDSKENTPIPDILTNEPASGFLGSISRSSPAVGGGLAGAAMAAPYGAPFGPMGMLLAGAAGAVMGGATGETARQGLVQATNLARNRPISNAGEVTQRIGSEGMAQGAGYLLGEGIGSGISAAGKFLRPSATKVGAQAIRVASGIPVKSSEAALRNPSILLDAPSLETAAAGYQAFERYTGLKGLGDMVKSAGRFPSESQLEEILFGAAQKAAQGSADPQDLYLASQAASNLKQMAKMGSPRYATLQSAINEAKSTVDDALGKIYPEYQNLRSDYFSSKVAEEFSNFLPVNKNLSPNVLRPTMAATGAVTGLLSGNPAALLALPAISPRLYGTAIKAAALAGKIPAGVYQNIGRAGVNSLADAYYRQSP